MAARKIKASLLWQAARPSLLPTSQRRLYSSKPTKTALITGGGSGLGLRVARDLAARGGWQLHIADKNGAAAFKAANEIPGATPYEVDVADYNGLARVFQYAYASSGGRLDFVFANAGVPGLEPIYDKHDTGLQSPPEINLTTVRVLYDSVIYSWYLGMHYFRETLKTHDRSQIDPNMVITASCMALYNPDLNPIYTGAKHGAVGFMRCVAPLSHSQGVRVNAILPGSFRSGLLSPEGWKTFPAAAETPVDKVAEAVYILLDNKDPYLASETRIDGRSQPKADGSLWGEALEISGNGLGASEFRAGHS
ncbi:hypothetical protein SBRCBS47491_001789 [Sporothrix bragantina]|uniref:NAD(P)-binding protein n=1 Tax=Sporothrix bragantina TaxID=671064 RepID=A0ABP0B1M8_9PEZI